MAQHKGESRRLAGAVRKDERRMNAHLFAMDRVATDQYVASQERPAKCYHIERNAEPPFGLIWIALARDQDAPDCLYVHVDYVFVVPGERGRISSWLAGEVVRKFEIWLGSQDLGPDTTVFSSSNPVTSEGVGFVRRLNAQLKAYCDARSLRLIGDGI